MRIPRIDMRTSGIPIFLWLFLTCSGITFLSAQEGIRPVYQQLLELRATGEDILSSSPFSELIHPSIDYSDYLRTARYYTLELTELKRIQSQRPFLLDLVVPGKHREITLSLYRSELFASNYLLNSTRGMEPSAVADALFYRGAILGSPASIAVVAVMPDGVRVMYSNPSGNFRIHQAHKGPYVMFEDKDLLQPTTQQCETGDNQVQREEPGQPQMRTSMTGNCVEVYFECDHESYLDNNSSISQTELWVAAIFNEVSTLYDNEGIPVSISEIFVWDSPDPYVSLNSTGSLLSAFVDRIASYNYNGRLAHLLSTRSLGGGIAYVNVLCSTTIPCAVSASLSTNFDPFADYSWTINVVAHEMGHNFGSKHTHDCVWNGDNTAIDGCGPAAGYDGSGNCPDGPLPESGTVMSYCHLVSGVGINFNNGFGDQPGALILSKYQNASCNTGECSPPVCTTLENPLPGSAQTDINEVIQWGPVVGASGYTLTVGTSPGSGDIANDLDVGLSVSFDAGGLPFNSTVYVKVVPYNSLGNASGCSEESFTTESDITPLCTNLTNPLDNSTGVDFNTTLSWGHAVGNQFGYTLNVGTTSGGGQIVNNMDVGNVNTYDPGLLPDDTTIYVQIKPYGPQGETPGCPVENFETVQAAPGDFCTSALPIACGETLSGNTEVATFDELSNCGTSNTAPGLWYTFAGFNGIVTFSTCNQANFDTKLTAYRGSCGDLVCITGQDDTQGCDNSTTSISFGTSAGETYYVLVHGWEASMGTYDLSMTCVEIPYCYSQSNIITDEWISYFALGDFENNSGASQYSDYTDMTIALALGENYPVEAAPGYSGTVYNEYFRIWIDWNQDDDFLDAGEMVFQDGPATSLISGNISVPVTANTGSTRMRVSMKYNGYPSSCETFSYGEVEDYTVDVRCNMVNTTADNGPGSLPYAVGCISSGDTVLFSPVIHDQTITLSSNIVGIDKDMYIVADPDDQITVYGQGTDHVFLIDAAVTAHIEGLYVVAGSASVGGAIHNVGTLVLKDVEVMPHPGGDPGAILIYNSEILTFDGASNIHK